MSFSDYMTETVELIRYRLPATDKTSPAPTLVGSRLVTEAGPAAGFAWDEFFRGSLRNPHTRTAYGRAVRDFLTWLAPCGVPLAQLTPGIVGSYFDGLAGSVPTKLHFDVRPLLVVKTLSRTVLQ